MQLCDSTITQQVAKKPNYYTRKHSALKAEIMAQFNQEDLGSSLKKHYSRLEHEKQITKEIPLIRPRVVQSDSQFLSDVKLHRPRIAREKEEKCLAAVKRGLEEEVSLKRFKREDSLVDDVIIRKSRIEKDIEEMRKIKQAEDEARLRERIALNKVLLIKVENVDANVQSDRKSSVSAFMRRKEYSEQKRSRIKSLSAKNRKCD
eukprot:TRINITY_DN8563_c0_g1_i2.p1 TRINITY_DN8563_c0_g1~~TRINITY_DN8563_c0_g1_i2.p1  ORF type:complete len:204 (-),score=61.32 TRINITY_DN8563_c0_g1_i2:98-709(-)